MEDTFEKFEKRYNGFKSEKYKARIILQGDTFVKYSYPYIRFKRIIKNEIQNAKKRQLHYQEARLRSFLGGFEAHRGNLDKAEEYYCSSIDISKKYLSDSDVAFFESALTHVWLKNCFYLKVIKKSLEIIRSNSLSRNYIALMNCYSRLGIAYKDLKDYNNALKYQKFILAIATKNKIQNTLVVNAYSNIGGIYNNMKLHQESKLYYMKAMKLAEKLNSKVHLGYIYTNLANIYAVLDNYPKSYQYSEKAITVGIQFDNKIILSNAYLNIAQTNFGEEKYVDSIKNLKISLSHLKRNGHLYIERNIYLYFEKSYSKLNDFKSAIKCFRKFVEVEAKLRDNDAKVKLKGFELKYQAQEKEKKILSLTTENQANILKLNQLLQQHEEEKRNLANKTEQQLRHELAHKLHNNVASTLVSSKMYLEELAHSSRLTQREKNYAIKALSQLDTTYKDMRALAQEIKEIDQKDLKSELRQLIDLYSSLPNLSFQSQININTPIDGDFVVDTLGIIKELLTNALKHSFANQFVLKVRANSKHFNLMLKFNGEKFEGTNANAQSSGYQSIRNYLQKYDGEIKHATNSLFSIIEIKISISNVKPLV